MGMGTRVACSWLLVLSACSERPPSVPPRDAGPRGARDAQAVVDDGGSDPGDGAVVDPDGGSLAPPGGFDPERVYLHGTFQEGACSAMAIEDMITSTRALAGGHCFDDQQVIRPSDGELLYVDQDRRVRVFRSDRWEVRDGYVTVVGDTLANDLRIDTPGCETEVHRLRIDPATSEVVYACGCGGSGVPCTFRTAAGALPLPAETYELWPGYGHDLVSLGGLGGLAIVSEAGVVAVDSAAVEDFPDYAAGIDAVRAREDGFRVLYQVIGEESMRLAHVALDGSVEALGAYPEPIGYQQLGNCVLDAADHMYCTAHRVEPVGEDVVLRFTLSPAGVTVEHDEADEPIVKLHASHLFTGP